MKNLLNKIKNKKEYIYILLASLIVCIPLFIKGFNIFRDDGIQHVCRLIGTEQTLKTGQFLPMIMSNFCNNFGYSWNLFYSPFTAYLPLLFKIFNFTYVNSLKIFEFFTVIISGIAMYKFTLNVTKNKNIAVFASIIYILAPYRITDMYIRNALAELTSFMFIPMIFNGMYKIINQEEKSYLLAFGAIGIILTHTVITMYTAILCFVYLIVFAKKLKNKKIIINLLINILFAIVCTSFFWVGLLQSKLATIYEVFVPGRMQRLDVLKYYKTEFYQLFITMRDQTMIYAIGFVNVIGLVLTPIAYKKIPKEYKKTYIVFLIMGLLLTLATLTIFPFEKLPKILTMIQFTFRLYEFTSFLFAFVVAINYGTIIKNFNIRDILVLTSIAVTMLVPYLDKIDFNSKYDENNYITPVRVSNTTGRVHSGMASMEYLPSKAFKNLDYLINRKDEPIIIENSGESKIEIRNCNKTGSNMTFEIYRAGEETTIELPYIYYIGYRIYVNGQEIKYEESEKGFIQIKLNEKNDESKLNDYDIEVKYTGTNAMISAFIVSCISFLVLVGINISKNYRKKYKKVEKLL